MFNTETSAGAVIFYLDSGKPPNKPQFLLVLSVLHNTWGFPKGHIEAGETERSAAQREIFEETGIRDITFIDGFREEDIYLTAGALPENKNKTIEKHSIYFLARAAAKQTAAQESEIKRAEWFGYEEAKNILPYPNQKIFLERALALINALQEIK